MRVYVVQEQFRYDADLGKVVPRFSSINKAEKFGELVFLLGPHAHPFDPDVVTGELHLKLSEFTDKDYLLLVGNPVLIGMATAVAAKYSGGGINFLQWSAKDESYSAISSRIF